jgi:hypothetical protein
MRKTQITRAVVAACTLLLTLAVAMSGASSAAAADYSNLNPGGPASLAEKVPVNIVFVGYEPGQVDAAAFLAALPKTYKPVVRSRLWYGVTEYLGLNYSFDYKTVFADQAYEDAFFGTLSSLAVKQSAVDGLTRTLFQEQYNAQAKNVLDVGENYFVDAPSVEKWLYQHPAAGIDAARDTIVFVNWWGRSDFKFHTYTKFGEPDPDTGYDFGKNRQSRKLIAWGGTSAADEETGFGAASRTWFYDLSAGPESWTDNWNVDDADVDGDGQADYRMPPVWEYFATGGYHPASALTGDLAKIARYVAINLLFTPSPLYPPRITPNAQPATINVDLNTYEGWNGVDASAQYLKNNLIVHELSELDPAGISADNQDLLFADQAKNCYQLWLNGNKCYPDRPYPGDANLFLYHALNQPLWRDGGGEYEGGIFNFATAENRAGGPLGFADDNWADGTQSGVFSFVSPGVVAAGYGLSTTEIHEFGHHIGMSHPHDGYDYETGGDYGPGGDTYFANSGDESNSMMSYIDLNWDFSQFDLDNMNRYQAAAHIANANAIAADVLASPNAKAASADLRSADAEIGLAKTALANHDYEGAFAHAKSAYGYVRAGAAKAGVQVTAGNNGWSVKPTVKPGKGPNKKVYSYKDFYGTGTKRGQP